MLYQRKVITVHSWYLAVTVWWCHKGRDGISNHQPHDGFLNRLFGRRSMLTSKLRVTGLCAGNSPEIGDSPHKWPVTRKMFPFDDVVMTFPQWRIKYSHSSAIRAKNGCLAWGRSLTEVLSRKSLHSVKFCVILYHDTSRAYSTVQWDMAPYHKVKLYWSS